jgi:hypothetical protein
MVDTPGRWKDHTQIAWVGIAPVGGNSLTLGSPSAGAVPGWPGNHISPTINFTSGPGGQITLQSYGGGGFVLDNKDNVLYGTSLDQDRNVTDHDGDSYTLSVRKRGWILSKWQIDVFRNGQESAPKRRRRSDCVGNLGGESCGRIGPDHPADARAIGP